MDCAFQADAFQNDAFQVCGVVPPAPSAMAGGGFYNYVRPRWLDDNDLAIVLSVLELLDDD